MSLRHSVGRTLGCGSCSTQLLRSFVAAAGVTLPPPVQQYSLRQRTRDTRPQLSQFSTTIRAAVENDANNTTTTSHLVSDDALLEDETLPEDVDEATSGAGAQLSDQVTPIAHPTANENENAVPWYLQVNAPIAQQDHPLSDRQRLPDLPLNPPALLQPILDHVSVDLGLDHLSLLDLRTLDPPPALGANTIMLVGTARSEKHLHVSADRLCRWLRSTHRLSPFADGLLGRNELKLKLRRKAKRSRLLSAVGAKETSAADLDDGIRTGWVCVNVGKVEGGLLPEQEELAARETKDFVGFGGQTDGSRIVVQMMTEEKRGQIDLETLWNGILRRAKKAKDEAQEEQRKAAILAADAGEVDVYRPQSLQRPAIQPRPGSRVHARAFHTSATWTWPTKSANRDSGAPIPTTVPIKNNISDQDTTSRVSQATLTLRHLTIRLRAMGPQAALAALGKAYTDTATTPFLAAFHNATPAFPDSEQWQLHLQLRCYAVALGHPRYTKKSIIAQLKDMRLARVLPSEETYILVLKAMLSSPLEADTGTTNLKYRRRAIRQALDVLDRMHEEGYNPTSEPVLRLLYSTTAFPPLPSYSPPDSSILHQTEATPSCPRIPMTLSTLLPSLVAYSISQAASSSQWSRLWSIWHHYPCSFLHRSSIMYTTLFHAIARTNSQTMAIDALRSCLPNMTREEPPIKLEGDVAAAVKQCLVVAEPNARNLGENGGTTEWAILWRRCLRGLRQKE